MHVEVEKNWRGNSTTTHSNINKQDPVITELSASCCLLNWQADWPHSAPRTVERSGNLLLNESEVVPSLMRLTVLWGVTAGEELARLAGALRARSCRRRSAPTSPHFPGGACAEMCTLPPTYLVAITVPILKLECAPVTCCHQIKAEEKVCCCHRDFGESALCQ